MSSDIVSGIWAGRSRSSSRTLPPESWVEIVAIASRLERLRVRERGVEAASELEHPRLEHRAFGLAVGGQIVEALSQVLLRGGDALLERERDLVATRGDRGVGVRQLALEPLRRSLPDAREPLAHHRVGLLDE